MILRPAGYDDCEFIAQCYNRNWPTSDKGRIFPVDVRNWIIRWNKTSNIEQGLVGEQDGVPVGVVIFGKNMFVATIYEIVVKDLGLGHGKGMWQALQVMLVDEGVIVAEFEGLPGAVSAKIEDGTFAKIGEGVGAHTGLPTIKGRVTADMEI